MEGGEIINLNSSSQISKPVDTISILVVDDDTTCLSIIAAILKKMKYEVVTLKNPIDALCTLRIRGGSFDLVVADVHMPEMNGFELQKVINREFKLPVVLMSADIKEGVMLRGLETGAAYFIAKPVSPEDVRDLWQYAAPKKKTNDSIDETENNLEQCPAEKSSKEMIGSASPANEEMETKKDSRRRCLSEDDDDKEEKTDSTTTKRPKVVWTNALHNRFLEAIRSVGLDRAVPKKILELMKVRGLTRENVASHLQKYRIFLRRVSDASNKIQPPNGSNLTNMAFEPYYASANPSLMLNKFNQVNETEPSPSNSVITGLRQSHLLFNRTNTWKPATGYTTPLYQPTRIGFRMESSNLQGGPLSDGQISNNLGSARNTIRTDLPIIPASPDSPINSMSFTRASTLGGVSTYIPAHRKSVNSCATNRIENLHLSTGFVGYQLADIEHLARKEYQVTNTSTCMDGITGSINQIQSGNMTTAATSHSHNTDLLAQCVSPGGFGRNNKYSSTSAGGVPEARVQPLLQTTLGGGVLEAGVQLLPLTTLGSGITEAGVQLLPSTSLVGGVPEAEVQLLPSTALDGAIPEAGMQLPTAAIGGAIREAGMQRPPTTAIGGGIPEAGLQLLHSTTFDGGIAESGVRLLPPTTFLHDNFCNLQGSDDIIGPEFDISAVYNISNQQKRSLDDLSSTLSNPFDLLSPAQHIGGEGNISSNFCNVGDQIDTAFPWFGETSSQHGQDCSIDAENRSASEPQLNNTLQSTNEQVDDDDDDEFLESLLASCPIGGDEDLDEIWC